MRYFAYLADSAFTTDGQGNELFTISTPFSRPYIVPSIEEKQRLHKKMTWYFRVFMTGLILCIAIFGRYFLQPSWFFPMLVGIVASQYIVLWFIFRHDLKTFQRSDVPIGWKLFYVGMAARHSLTKLVLGFIGSILFVVLGLFEMYLGFSLWVTGFVVLFFGPCAVAWGYTIALKIKMRRAELRASAGDTEIAAR